MSIEAPISTARKLVDMRGELKGFKTFNFWPRILEKNLSKDECVKLLKLVNEEEAKKFKSEDILLSTIRKGENKIFSYELLSVVMKQFNYPPKEFKDALLQSNEEQVKKIISEFPVEVIDAMRPIYEKFLDMENMKLPITKKTKTGDLVLDTEEKYKEYKNKEFITSIVFGPLVSFIEADAATEKPKIKELLQGKYNDDLKKVILDRITAPKTEEEVNIALIGKVEQVMQANKTLEQTCKNDNEEVNSILSGLGKIHETVNDTAKAKEVKQSVEALSKYVSELEKAGSFDIKQKFIEKFKEISPSVLFAAVELGDFEKIRRVIELGANTLAINQDGMTALEMAKSRVTEEQYKNLVETTSNFSSVRIDKIEESSLDDPKTYAMLKEHSEVFKYSENYQYFESMKEVEESYKKYTSDPSEENQKDLFSKFDALYKNFIEPDDGKVNFDLDAKVDVKLNLPDNLVSKDFISKFPLKDVKDIEGAMRGVKEINQFCRKYVVASQSGIPSGDMIILNSRLPIHEMVLKGGSKMNDHDKNLFNIILKHNDVNQKNVEGVTPLQLAAIKGDKKLVDKLLEAGANPKVTTTNYNRNGLTKLLMV